MLINDSLFGKVEHWIGNNKNSFFIMQISMNVFAVNYWVIIKAFDILLLHMTSINFKQVGPV